MSEHNITLSQIESKRAAKDVLLAAQQGKAISKMLYQNLSNQQYKLVIINSFVEPNHAEVFMTLQAAVDAYNAIDVREKSASEITDFEPPQHVLDDLSKHCQCCPRCSTHPCDGVSAGDVCDDIECDCYGDNREYIKLED